MPRNFLNEDGPRYLGFKGNNAKLFVEMKTIFTDTANYRG